MVSLRNLLSFCCVSMGKPDTLLAVAGDAELEQRLQRARLWKRVDALDDRFHLRGLQHARGVLGVGSGSAHAAIC